MLIDGSALTLIPIAAGLITSFITLLLLWRFQSATAPAATLLFASLSLWLFAEGLSLEMRDVQDRILIGKLIYPGVVAVPVAVLLLAVRATRRDAWVTGGRLLALWIVPAITLVMAATNGVHGWLWSSIDLVQEPTGETLAWRHGPWFWVTLSYAYLLLGSATWLLAVKYRRDWHRYRTEALLVFTGLAAPWISNALYVSGYSPLGTLDLTPYGFALTAIFLAWGLGREGVLEATPVSRSTVVQELGDGLLVVDPRGRVVDLNAAARSILGVSEVDVRDLHAREALACCPRLLTLLEEPPATASTMIEIEAPRGLLTYDVRVSELRERHDEVAGRLVVLRDVTDYLRASEAARAAGVAKAQFLANMSHEIRTPMNGVLGLAQHLAHLELDTEQRTVVEDILTSGSALLQVIDDILDVSKLEAGKLRIDPTPFDPRRLAADVAKLFAPRARTAGIRLEASVCDGVPAWLLGDGGRIRQVLVNLVSNAVKFTKKGSVAVHLRCDGLVEARATLRFEVRDTGIGIPPDAIEKIFDAFTQADASTTRRFGGTGLGLTISREIVACMGGELGVESEEGRGSCFWFVLPLPVCEPPAAHAEAGTVARAPARASGDRSLRVLAAEDNAVNQRVLLRLLERLGCRVDLAADGREAVERARGGGYDLVLMDCQMPVLDGFGATREIRALESEAGRVPIVAVTAHALAGDRERCLENGMDDYVTKPIKLDELERVIARWAPRAAQGSVPPPARG
ncbi:MAG: response regulator [Deltaproteobacteria bacterium]|nr:response regulator [Deltaproteobacteria bacterium]